MRSTWQRLVVIATVLVFLTTAVYLYAFRFFDWLDSDVASIVLLAAKVVHAKFPVVTDYYYCNGDVWTVATHLFSVVPVAVFGVGPLSMWLGVVLGFVVEFLLFVKCHVKLSGDRWTAIFAGAVTFMAWSNIHVAYYFINLMYGCYTLLWLSIFTLTAGQIELDRTRRGLAIFIGVLVTGISIHNPVRAFVFMLVPALVACAWRWNAVARRRRVHVALPLAIGWLVGMVVYTLVLPRVITFSIPKGHIAFHLEDLSGIATNLDRLGEGLLKLCGGSTWPLLAIPGALLLAGAFVLVVREVFASRELAALRFVCVAALAQTAIVVVPIVVGNLMVDPGSIRYLLPSTSIVLGLAAIIAMRAASAAEGWVRRLATWWLIAVPITAALAIADTAPPKPERNVWPDAAELDKVGQEIARRGLTHGFAGIQAADLISVDSRGTALVCPIYFRDFISPERWLTEVGCYQPSRIPQKFFVVADQTEQDRAAIRASLSAPIDSFEVGPTYEVYVFQTTAPNMRWLDLPLPDDDRKAFPLRIPANHLQLRHGNVRLEDNRLVATGEPGAIVYGPYITLPRGRYTVRWVGSVIPSPGEVEFVVAAGGQDVLAQESLATAQPTSSAPLVELKFKLTESRKEIEFLVRSGHGGRVSLDEVVIERR
jgi:hypothetical protein